MRGGEAHPESHFRVNVFDARLDVIINQLLQRFVALRETSDVFQAMQPLEMKSATDDALYEHIQHRALLITTTGT